MNLCGRIAMLERDVSAGTAPPPEEDEPERTDEEEADMLGSFLFASASADIARHADQPAEWRERVLYPSDPLLRSWAVAVADALAQGHTEYHVGLRPAALAVWLDCKPGILEHRRTHGRWVWIDPPSRLEVMMRTEPEKYRTLPTQEMMNLYLVQGQTRSCLSAAGRE